MVSGALSYLTGVGALAMNLKPCAAGTERVMRNDADAYRLRLGVQSSIRFPRPNENATLCDVGRSSLGNDTSSRISRARSLAAALEGTVGVTSAGSCRSALSRGIETGC